MTAAIAPVTTNVAIVVPIILPARLRLFMLATAPEIDAKTSGTTMQNIMLINTVPSGLMATAADGASQPNSAPRIMAASMMPRNV